MKLTDKQCQNAKIEEGKTLRKLADGHGLYLLVEKKGKYWRYKYTHLNKENAIALGVYPETSLAEAREKAHKARKLVAEGRRWR